MKKTKKQAPVLKALQWKEYGEPLGRFDPINFGTHAWGYLHKDGLDIYVRPLGPGQEGVLVARIRAADIKGMAAALVGQAPKPDVLATLLDSLGNAQAAALRLR